MSARKIPTNPQARVLMYCVQNLTIQPVKPLGNAMEAKLRIGVRLDDGLIKIARLCAKEGWMVIGKRSNGAWWAKITPEGRRALADYRNSPPPPQEQLIELAAANGIEPEVMQERLITNAWKQIASWAQDLPTLKWQMALAHPDMGGTSEAFIEAHAKYQTAKRLAKNGGSARTRKSKGRHTEWKPAA